MILRFLRKTSARARSRCSVFHLKGSWNNSKWSSWPLRKGKWLCFRRICRFSPKRLVQRSSQYATALGYRSSSLRKDFRTVWSCKDGEASVSSLLMLASEWSNNPRPRHRSLAILKILWKAKTQARSSETLCCWQDRLSMVQKRWIWLHWWTTLHFCCTKSPWWSTYYGLSCGSAYAAAPKQFASDTAYQVTPRKAQTLPASFWGNSSYTHQRWRIFSDWGLLQHKWPKC